MNKIIAFAGFALAASQLAAGVYVGASAGYLIDSEEELIAARVGFVLKEAASIQHSLEAEVGLSSDSGYGLEMDIIPVLVNYRATFTVPGPVTPFAGAGVGFSHVQVREEGSSFEIDDGANPLTTQVFGGASFSVAPMVSLHAAARYIWIDDADLFGTSIEVGDDIALELGVTIHF